MRLRNVSLLALFMALALCGLAVASPDLGLMIITPDGESYLFAFPGEDIMRLEFEGSVASFDILTDTSLFQDAFSVSASGAFSGFQNTGVGFLDRKITFGVGGSASDLFQAGAVAATFTFTTEDGTLSQQFVLGDYTLDDAEAFARIVLDYAGDFRISVLNGTLLTPVGSAEPEVVAFLAGGGGEVCTPGVDCPPNKITFDVQNKGTAPFDGPVCAGVGLAYSKFWVPETCTCFCTASFGRVHLAPGEKATFEVEIPAVPRAAIETFRQRQALYASYVDPDPGVEFIGVTVHMGMDHFCAFLPFKEQVTTTAMKKPKTD
jgi:hypothetical protein